MSNTIEDTIRDIVICELDDKKDDLIEEVKESINLSLPDYDIVDAFNKLEERIKVLRVAISLLEERIK